MTASSQPRAPIIIARIGKPHGVTGWIHLEFFVQNKQHAIDQMDHWLSEKPNQAQWQPITIKEQRKHHHQALIKLPGCDSPEQARDYTNYLIALPADHLPKLEEGDYYWHQLIGIKVVTTDGVELGKLTSLYETGANDVMIVDGKRQRHIPYTDHAVVEIQLQNKTLIVDWDPDF